MAWTIDYTDTAKRSLKKIDRTTARKIVDYLDEVGRLENPKSRGKRLSGPLGGLWRYRVGDYRAVCTLEDGKMVILVVLIGHRSKVYRES